MPIVLYAEESGFGDGDPVVSLPGSGMAVPRGVEATFQYNDLIFNDTTVIDKYRITLIDGLDDPDIRDSREDNPGDHGETAYNSYYGGRTIAISGRIEAYQLNKLRDMQQALRGAFAELEEKPFYFLTGDSDTDHYINCRKFTKNHWSEEQKSTSVFFREFLVTLRASNPRFLRNKKKTVSLDPDLGSSFTIGNEGNFSAEPIYKIYGPITDVEFHIESGDNIEAFKLLTGATIADGDYWEVDIARRTLRNSSGSNVFAYLHDDSAWPKLQAGNNYLTIPSGKCDTSGANAHIEVIYRDSWI